MYVCRYIAFESMSEHFQWLSTKTYTNSLFHLLVDSCPRGLREGWRPLTLADVQLPLFPDSPVW